MPAGSRWRYRWGTAPGTLSFLLTDHLGSTSVVVDAVGVQRGETHYLPFGEEWYSGGVVETDYRFTGQRLEAEGLGGAELYDYGSRWYDPAVGRFIQADTIVPRPGNPQNLNRYSYASNKGSIWCVLDQECGAPLVSHPAHRSGSSGLPNTTGRGSE